ncbi:MAG: ergothioneine biosynthesis protein EgtB [Chitinophagaceae bacterium]|nr:ergothioneine biosynthesis protein EgtB [Chitinophagaceae bacterium]
MTLLQRYKTVRQRSEALAVPLLTEDFSVQPAVFVSPPKWHLAHITWFWEQFVLLPFLKGYKVYDENFAYLFNSYYNNLGERVLRPHRGNMTRPPLEAVMRYRAYIDLAMQVLLQQDIPVATQSVIHVGLNHEEQHQELFLYDVKYILGLQPGFPVYGDGYILPDEEQSTQWLPVAAGLYQLGYKGAGFCFDNEQNRHSVYLNDFEIADRLVTNGEYLEFISDGGYENFNLWHDDGWHWKNKQQLRTPLYWHLVAGEWYEYDLHGLHKLNLQAPVNHISLYEAHAYAAYRNRRLPTEAEWEIASDHFRWGKLWEWTNSAYLPYPGFNTVPGALGEYNGKFMINTMVLRGASIATTPGHSRKTYRNFFYPDMRWQYSGIRLVR